MLRFNSFQSDTRLDLKPDRLSRFSVISGGCLSLIDYIGPEVLNTYCDCPRADAARQMVCCIPTISLVLVKAFGFE